MHNPPGRKSGVYPIWNIIEYPKRIRVLSVAIYWYFPFSIRVISIFNPGIFHFQSGYLPITRYGKFSIFHPGTSPITLYGYFALCSYG